MLSCDRVGPAEDIPSVGGCQMVESRMLCQMVGWSRGGIGMGAGDVVHRVSAM